MENWESLKGEFEDRSMSLSDMNPTPIYPEVKQTAPLVSNSAMMVYPSGRKRATKACISCKQRHTRCGFERPCHRCKSLGFQCVDPPSKKRGSKKSENSLKLDRGIQKNTKWRFKDYSEIQKIQITPQKREFLVPSNETNQYPQTLESPAPQYIQIFSQEVQEVQLDQNYYFQQESDVFSTTNPLPINWVNYSTLNDA